MTAGGARWESKDVDGALAVVHRAGLDALEDAAEGLLTHANLTVPHEEGTLEGSGVVTLDRSNGEAAASYDTPYAVRQHEDLTLRHQTKGRAKWLERTWQERAQVTFAFIADRIRAVL